MVLIGRLTNDATVFTTKDERKVVNFTVAVNDSYKPKGSTEWKTSTTYYTCGYWITPEVAKVLKKGALVELSGRVYATSYTDMEGNVKASLNLHVDTIKVHAQAKATATQAVTAEKAEETDDLPF
jgi:single-strand DNA-binding protein